MSGHANHIATHYGVLAWHTRAASPCPLHFLVRRSVALCSFPVRHMVIKKAVKLTKSMWCHDSRSSVTQPLLTASGFRYLAWCHVERPIPMQNAAYMFCSAQSHWSSSSSDPSWRPSSGLSASLVASRGATSRVCAPRCHHCTPSQRFWTQCALTQAKQGGALRRIARTSMCGHVSGGRYVCTPVGASRRKRAVLVM